MKSSRRAKASADLRSDDTAVLQVLESIMAAMILLGAILFVTVTSNPVQESGAPGINLSTIAEDTLQVLQSQPGLDDPERTRLDEIIDQAIQGDTDSVETFLRGVVPSGTRFAMRLDNGVGPLQMVPAGGSSGAVPRDASGATTYVFPNWTAHSSYVDAHAPGDELDFSNWTTLSAPDGSTIGPGGETWLDLWTASEPGQDRIPASAPYGVWDCSGGSCVDFRIVLEDGTAVDRPLYSVELLLWEGV